MIINYTVVSVIYLCKTISNGIVLFGILGKIFNHIDFKLFFHFVNELNLRNWIELFYSLVKFENNMLNKLKKLSIRIFHIFFQSVYYTRILIILEIISKHKNKKNQ